jgi:hypothetical protein
MEIFFLFLTFKPRGILKLVIVYRVGGGQNS